MFIPAQRCVRASREGRGSRAMRSAGCRWVCKMVPPRGGCWAQSPATWRSFRGRAPHDQLRGTHSSLKRKVRDQQGLRHLPRGPAECDNTRRVANPGSRALGPGAVLEASGVGAVYLASRSPARGQTPRRTGSCRGRQGSGVSRDKAQGQATVGSELPSLRSEQLSPFRSLPPSRCCQSS